MKFTTYQSEYITKYLIHQGLEYKEFIDEMHDHFCGSVEVKMNEGLNFHQAVSATKEEFNEEIYQTNIFGLFPKRGLKAIEKRFFQSKKREIFNNVRFNFKSTIFSIGNLIVLCYAALVIYFFNEGAIQKIYNWLILLWVLPNLLIVSYIRRKLKVTIDNASGIGRLLASKRQRVRSIYVDTLLYVNGNDWIGAYFLICIPLSYANKYGYLSDLVCFCAFLFMIVVTLLVQVQAIKMIPRVNKLINS